MTWTEPPSGTGPPIERLTRRLAETPGEFLARPGTPPAPEVGAVVSDLLVLLGAEPLTAAGAARFDQRDQRPGVGLSPDEAGAVLVATWLLADPWFAGARPSAAAVLAALDDAAVLGGHAATPTLVADDDRREELARRVLASLGMIPAGETPAQAQDRLATLDSVERARVLAATAAAERRAAEVREAMHRRAAAEAAAKASRE